MSKTRPCSHVHKAGYVTNQPGGYDKDKPLASRTVCAKPSCIDQASAWVEKLTKMPAHFREFNEGATK